MLHRLLLLIAALGVSACAVAPPAAPVAKDAAADAILRIPLVTTNGDATDLERASRGQVTVVAMWATWCDACKKELPSLLRLEQRAQARGDFRVVAVAVGEDAGDVRAFGEGRRLLADQLVDEHYALSARGRDKVPTTLVIDRRGHVVHQGDALDRAALSALRRALRD